MQWLRRTGLEGLHERGELESRSMADAMMTSVTHPRHVHNKDMRSPVLYPLGHVQYEHPTAILLQLWKSSPE